MGSIQISPFVLRSLNNDLLLRRPAISQTRWRGKESLLIRRDATPHPSLHLALFEQPEE
jgi:hypothetical protein